MDWRASYNLGKSIREKLESSKTDIEQSLGKKLYLRSYDLSGIFYDLALIISRINEDGAQVNRREELFEIAHDRMWTDEEEKELEGLGNYLVLDVKTLYINIMIFMDALAYFLSLCVRSRKQPISKSFAKFKKDLENYRGREIEEIREKIYEKTAWLDEAKDFRDDFIVHQPAARSTLEFLNGVLHIPLTTRKKGYDQRHIIVGATARNISIVEIDSSLTQLKELLEELSEYLCQRLNMLPFEAEYCGERS